MNGNIDLVIAPRMRDLGGFSVGRVLPYAKRRMVGPFIFFDEMGPADFAPGKGIDVRPHPHIGLATVTYLFDGEIRHKDNLGFDQVIRPGDVNWMTAGRGIVHSERTDDDKRKTGQRMHGIQSWIALPESDEETEPSFHHHPKSSLPVIEGDKYAMRLIAGEAFDELSPVQTYSPMYYLAVEAEAGAEIPVPVGYPDNAAYGLSGSFSMDGETYGSQNMVVFSANSSPVLKVTEPARLMLLGGEQLGKRHIWWNLVSSEQTRIEKAKADWRDIRRSRFQRQRVSSAA